MPARTTAPMWHAGRRSYSTRRLDSRAGRYQISRPRTSRFAITALGSVPVLLEGDLPDILGRLTVGLFLDDRLAADFRDLTGERDRLRRAGPHPAQAAGQPSPSRPSGVSPRSVTVSAGSRVTFVNNDSRVHDMNSDPHPAHTDCPEINQVGFLSAGQSRRRVTSNPPAPAAITNHNQDTNTSLQGTIVIQ